MHHHAIVSQFIYQYQCVCAKCYPCELSEHIICSFLNYTTRGMCFKYQLDLNKMIFFGLILGLPNPNLVNRIAGKSVLAHAFAHERLQSPVSYEGIDILPPRRYCPIIIATTPDLEETAVCCARHYTALPDLRSPES